MHLHLRTHVGIPELSQLVADHATRARLIDLEISGLTDEEKTWDAFIDAITVTQLSGLWPDYEQVVTERLIGIGKRAPAEAWVIGYRTFSELCHLGHYEAGERLLVELKEAFGHSVLDGSLYLSAVGHISLMWWLVELRERTGTPRKVSFRVNPKLQANSLLARKLLARGTFSGWEVHDLGAPKALGEPFPDLELFPTDLGHSVIRRSLGPVMHQTRHRPQPKFLTFDEKEERLAVNAIKSWGYDLEAGQPLIGMHVRTARDPLSGGRDANPAKYLRLIPFIHSLGYRVAIIGTESQARFFRGHLPPNVIDLTIKNSPEREIVQNYIWAHAKFLVGNLSGGTMPAIAYGTPVLWADIFPLRHFRPFSTEDLMLPKLVLNDQREFVSYDRVMHPGGSRYDLESLPLLSGYGYAVQEIDDEALRGGFLDMHNKVRDIRTSYPIGEKELIVEKYYERLGLTWGAVWSPSFMLRFARLIR
jgi:putative glycosyltransferase (TIGR04372 family)